MQQFLRKLFDPGRTVQGGGPSPPGSPIPNDIPLVDVPRETELKELKPRSSKGGPVFPSRLSASFTTSRGQSAAQQGSPEPAPSPTKPGPATTAYAEFGVAIILWSLQDPQLEKCVSQWRSAGYSPDQLLQNLCRTGIALCHFINVFAPATIDERAIHHPVEVSSLVEDNVKPAVTPPDTFTSPSPQHPLRPTGLTPAPASPYSPAASPASPTIPISTTHEAWPAGDADASTQAASSPDVSEGGKVIQSITSITVDPEWFSIKRSSQPGAASTQASDGILSEGTAHQAGQEQLLKEDRQQVSEPVTPYQQDAQSAQGGPPARTPGPGTHQGVQGLAQQQQSAKVKPAAVKPVPQAVRWNWQLAHSAALSLGCCLAGVSPESLAQGQVVCLVRFVIEIMANHYVQALMDRPQILAMHYGESVNDAWLSFSSPQELINRWVRQRLDSDTLLGSSASLPQNWPVQACDQIPVAGSLGGLQADFQLIRQLLEKELLSTDVPQYIDGNGLADIELVLGLRNPNDDVLKPPAVAVAPVVEPSPLGDCSIEQHISSDSPSPQEHQQPAQEPAPALELEQPVAVSQTAASTGEQPLPQPEYQQEPAQVDLAADTSAGQPLSPLPETATVQDELEHVHAEVTINLARKLGVDMPMQASWLKTGGEPFAALFLLACLHKHFSSTPSDLGPPQQTLDQPLDSRPASEEGHLEQRRTNDSAASGQELTPVMRRALEASDSIRRRTGAGGHRDRPKDVYSVDAQEEKLLRAWLNSLLAERNIRVTSLFDANMCTGWPLLVACDTISPGCVMWHRTFEPPFGSNKHRRVPPKLMAVENGNQVCHVATKIWRLPLVNIGGIDIAEGHKMALMSLVWQMMRHHMVVMLGALGPSTTKLNSPPGSVASYPDSPMASGTHRHFGNDQPLPVTPFAQVLDARATPTGSSRRSSVTGSDAGDAGTGKPPAWTKDKDSATAAAAPVTPSAAGADTLAKPDKQTAQQLEEEVVSWVNKRLQKAAGSTPLRVTGLTDSAWASGQVLLRLMALTWPGVVKEQHIATEVTPSAYELNARYALSVARSLGCHVYSCTWEDVVQVRPRPLLTLLAALMAQDLQQRAA